MICKSANGSKKVVGIVSWGQALVPVLEYEDDEDNRKRNHIFDEPELPEIPDVPTVFTHISPYRAWIDQNIIENQVQIVITQNPDFTFFVI